MQAQYLRVRDVAELCGVTPHTVRSWLKAGLLQGRRIGPRGHWLIDAAILFPGESRS